MRRLAFAVVLLASLAGNARAAVTTYTSSAAFLAALGSAQQFTETYQGAPANNTLLGPTVGPGPYSGSSIDGNALNYAFSSSGFLGGSNPQGRIDNTFVALGPTAATAQSLAAWRAQTAAGEGSFESFFYPGESFTVTRPGNAPMFAIGAFFNSTPSNTQPGDLFISTSVGSVTNIAGQQPEFGTGQPNPTLYFLGLISDTPFTSATFGENLRLGPNGQPLPPEQQPNGFNLDNLTVGLQATVPEPATLVVLSGLLAVGGGLAARRRRTATA